MKKTNVKFKNLPIGYYFILDDKIYLKTNNFNASQLYSNLNLDYFSDITSHYGSINKDLEYTRPSALSITLEAEELVEFIKLSDIRQYIVDEFYKLDSKTSFRNIKIGDCFYNKENDTYYKKISYYKAIPFYSVKLGISDIQTVNISVISSSLCTSKEYNAIYYNGSLLTYLDINAWNILYFNPEFSSFRYQTFDTERNYDLESNRMLNFINSIPNDSIVFIVTSNNPQIVSNIHIDNSKPEHFKRIYSDYNTANTILSSIGFDETLISNLGRSDSIMMISKKNKEKLFYKKLKYNPKDYLYLNRDVNTYKVIEYNYHLPNSYRDYKFGVPETFKLDDQYRISDNSEVYARILYNIKPDDPIVLSNNTAMDMI